MSDGHDPSNRKTWNGQVELIASLVLAVLNMTTPAYGQDAKPASTATSSADAGGPGESCRARSDCADGLKCLQQLCVDENEGVSCQSRGDCGGRLACIDKVCSSQSRTAGPNAPAGHPEGPGATSVPPMRSTADDQGVKDGVRIRGGFGLGGGIILTPDSGVVGGLVALQLRLGVQVNHYFGIIYANTPQVLVIGNGNGVGAAFVDWNTIIATLTLGHFFELGAGPSFDYYAGGACTLQGCVSGSGFGFGLHERLAFLIGGLSGNGPRRSGFQIGIDAHQDYVTDGTIPITLIGQLGGEWY